MLHETLEYLGIAFICSVLLIIMSKIILQALIRRPADYYSAEELRQEELMLNAGGISITSEHETTPEGEPIQSTHLDAKLGASQAAEPETIIEEIPESVHESIEVGPEQEIQDVIDTESAAETAEAEPVHEIIEAEPEQEIIQTEPVDETADAEPDLKAGEEPAPEQPEAQKDFGFSIKAKPSRTRKPKNKDEEEAAEDLEQAKAAMEQARKHEDSDRTSSEWTESYADIRSSLEKAFTEKMSDKSAEKDKPAKRTGKNNKGNSKNSSKNSGKNSSNNNKNNNKNSNNKNRRRAPSMNMNKKELQDIAASRGIDVPPEATKREILDLIYSDRRKRY